MGPAGHASCTKGGQRGLIGGDPLLPGQMPTTSSSAVLQGRFDGGVIASCPYETPAAGPFRASGGPGSVHQRVRQARRQPAAVGATVRWGRPPHPPLPPSDVSAEEGSVKNGDFVVYFA
jgi:hypothetical protein